MRNLWTSLREGPWNHHPITSVQNLIFNLALPFDRSWSEKSMVKILDILIESIKSYDMNTDSIF